MSNKPRDRVKTVANALHMEKNVSLELSRALQAQIIVNDVLRERIAELEASNLVE